MWTTGLEFCHSFVLTDFEAARVSKRNQKPKNPVPNGVKLTQKRDPAARVVPKPRENLRDYVSVCVSVTSASATFSGDESKMAIPGRQ